MKRRTATLWFGFLLLLSSAWLPRLQAKVRPWRQGVTYQVRAKLDTLAKRLACEMQIDYRNNSPDTLSQIYLLVPANAYHDPENTAVKEMRRFAGDNIEFGLGKEPKLTIETLQFLSIGRETEFPLQAYDFNDTVLELTLPYPLLPGDRLRLGLSFYQDFRSLKKESGRSRIPKDFVLWLPRVAVYDENGWQAEPFHFLMEPFDVYAEFADFDVTLTVPYHYVVAASGTLVTGDPGWKTVTADTAWNDTTFTAWRDSIRQALEYQGRKLGPRTVRFRAENVQNFGWSASPKFLHFQHNGGVRTHVFYRGKTDARKWVKELLRWLDDAYAYLEAYFGPLPSSEFVIVQAGREPTALPGMAWLLEVRPFAVVYHLTAGYLPGVVGSNGIQESWLAKGLQMYMGKRFSEKTYGRQGYDTREVRQEMSWLERQYPLPSLDELLRNFTRMYMESGQDEPIANAIHQYKDPFALIFNAYLKAEIFYEMLHYVVGDSAFRAATRRLVQDYAFHHITEDELRAVFEEQYGQPLDWFFGQWLHDTPTVDYAKEKVRTYQRNDSTWVTEVEIKRLGDGVMPVDVELELGEGEKIVERWSGQERVGRVVVETRRKPKHVRVDPDDRIMDANQLNNRPLRLELRFDLPLLKYLYQPPDALLVLWRPLVRINTPDKLRLGLGTRSSYRAFYHNVTAEASVGLATADFDFRLGYHHPLSRKNLFNRYYLMARKIEGRFEADAHLEFKGADAILGSSGRSLSVGVNYSTLLNDAYTLREVVNDTGRVKFQEWEDAAVVLAYLEGQLTHTFAQRLQTQMRVRIHSALPGGDARFTKLSARLQVAYEPLNWRVLVRGTAGTSFGPDRLPLQDQFRVEGAAPRERLMNDVAPTGTALTTFGHRYLPGQGYLRGYAGQPLPAERFASVNLEIGLRRAFIPLRPFAFFDHGWIWPTRDAAPETRSDAGFGLALLGEGLNLFGGNLGLGETLSIKFWFPLWLSHPPPGQAQTQFRWYVSFGKAL